MPKMISGHSGVMPLFIKLTSSGGYSSIVDKDINSIKLLFKLFHEFFRTIIIGQF